MIKKASIIYSSQEHTMDGFRWEEHIRGMRTSLEVAALVSELIRELKIRLEKIQSELTALKTKINEYKNEIGIPLEKQTE